jgi:hypothetical protein
MGSSDEPRRLRWSVPRADVSTNRWLDTQYDISQSLRLLIRESIQRDGYIDVVNRPVEQLPRRGRPPVVEQDENESAAVGPGSEARTVQAGSPAGADEEPAASDQRIAARGDQSDAAEAVPPRLRESAPAPVEGSAKLGSAPAKQASIDEIMASTRR